MWQSWLNGVLGLWILVSPFIGIGDVSSGMTTNMVIVGIVVAILGFWAAGVETAHGEHRHQHA
ncbi:MAG: SPW repeat protein [Patescibacteria group bacterium]|nr:SPW repeat protein [Patescibacteria group bacterium]MDE1941236.1 SPW repeat protein [Patescibacteria group bacterium]MDE1966769.1 SPW repeat protein [Patescibacteria group bacterium]